MPLRNNEVEELITKVETICDNAVSSTEIMAVLTPYGYTAEVLGEIKSGKLANLKAASTDQVKEYSDQYLATENLAKLQESFNQTYNRHVALIRLALKNDPVQLKAIEASGQRKKSFSKYLQQAETFYNGLDSYPAVKAELLKFNTTEEELAGMKTKLEELQAAKIEQNKEKGEAQLATEKRDDLYDDLSDWHTTFVGVAKIAFEGNSQALEILGIFVRNE